MMGLLCFIKFCLNCFDLNVRVNDIFFVGNKWLDMMNYGYYLLFVF